MQDQTSLENTMKLVLFAGDNTVTFNFPIEEDTIIDWDGENTIPVVKVEMKLRGNRQNKDLGIFATR